MSSLAEKGVLISFDGLDSSGKATQTRLLVQRLKDEGFDVVQFQTPDYSTPSGKELRQRLQGKLGDWNGTPWQEKMRYFARNRSEHRAEVIDALAAGKIVIYDRYVPSSLAFITVEALKPADVAQRREEIYKAVEEVEYGEYEMPHEHLSIFLDVPPRVAEKLLQGRKQKNMDEDEYTDTLSVQERLYGEYENMASVDSKRFARIRCTNEKGLHSIEEVAQMVWSAATDILN